MGAGNMSNVPPLGGAVATGGNVVDLSGGGLWLAGGDVLVGTVAAVAASQDTAWSALMKVWGAAPTLTLAGASTPTITTNTSRFETG